MRGFVSLILALLIVYSIFLLFTFNQRVVGMIDATEEELLVLEKYHIRELEIKRAITNKMKHSARDAVLYSIVTGDVLADEITEEVGFGLADLEDLEDSYYYIDRLSINFWCGFIREDEINNLPKQMLQEGRAIICENCKNLDELAIRTQYELDITETEYELGITGDPVTACTAFLAANHVGRTVTTLSFPDPRVIPKWTGIGKPSFGASILDTRNDISSIVILPAGSKVRW